MDKNSSSLFERIKPLSKITYQDTFNLVYWFVLMMLSYFELLLDQKEWETMVRNQGIIGFITCFMIPDFIIGVRRHWKNSNLFYQLLWGVSLFVLGVSILYAFLSDIFKKSPTLSSGVLAANFLLTLFFSFSGTLQSVKKIESGKNPWIEDYFLPFSSFCQFWFALLSKSIPAGFYLLTFCVEFSMIYVKCRFTK
jgi:hypothetical protein